MSHWATLRDLLARGALDEAQAQALALNEPRWERMRGLRAVAEAMGAKDRLADAARLLDAAERTQPNQVWVAQVQAALSQRAGDAPSRLMHLARAFALAPANEPTAQDCIEALNEAGRSDDAVRVAREHRDHVEFAHDRLPVWQAPSDVDSDAAQRKTRLYLDLLEKAVANWLVGDARIQLGKLLPFSEDTRRAGRDIPSQAHTMIGLQRLRHLRVLAEAAIAQGVPGDFVETGVWRGGACILLAGVLRAHEAQDRRVVLADSFEGLPPPDPRYAKDALSAFDFHLRPELAVGLDEVRGNFERYGLLDERVVFLKGLFRDTLPAWPAREIAILRMDGDLYSSTMDALVHLYPKVAPGGWVICDDYGVVIDARRAVLDFRAGQGISAPMFAVDGDAAFWRKPA
jgi:O-methyltransferase